ncbi:helix-turn-helix transcriptional regulator [Streptomyces sp. SP18BB07]|nr:helix-turn-helix transcriptional regulator [Streptomyces sp. SP18BB07]
MTGKAPRPIRWGFQEERSHADHEGPPDDDKGRRSRRVLSVASGATAPRTGRLALRRSTPDPRLRREELATLAVLSVEYLERLQQGRDTNLSIAVLAALARTCGSPTTRNCTSRCRP